MKQATLDLVRPDPFREGNSQTLDIARHVVAAQQAPLFRGAHNDQPLLSTLGVPCAVVAELKRLKQRTTSTALRAPDINHAAAGRLIGTGTNARYLKCKLEAAEKRLHQLEVLNAD